MLIVIYEVIYVLKIAEPTIPLLYNFLKPIYNFLENFPNTYSNVTLEFVKLPSYQIIHIPILDNSFPPILTYQKI